MTYLSALAFALSVSCLAVAAVLKRRIQRLSARVDEVVEGQRSCVGQVAPLGSDSSVAVDFSYVEESEPLKTYEESFGPGLSEGYALDRVEALAEEKPPKKRRPGKKAKVADRKRKR